MTKKTVSIIMLVTLGIALSIGVFLIVWDVILATDNVPGNTITELVRVFTHDNPWVVFLAGLLGGFTTGFIGGHFWWRPRPRGLK